MSYNPQNPNGQTTSANSSPVVIASDQSAVPISGTVGITANSAVNNAQVSGTAVDVNSGLKSAGTQRVVLATDQPQLTNAFKVDGSATTQPISGTVTANAGTGIFTVNATPATTGGWSVSSQTAFINAKVAVKGTAGTLGGYMFYNPNAAVTYIQVFDVASASVTLGSTTPTYVIPLPPASGANIEFTLGVNHATAITAAATTTPTGSSAPASSLTGFFLYK